MNENNGKVIAMSNKKNIEDKFPEYALLNGSFNSLHTISTYLKDHPEATVEEVKDYIKGAFKTVMEMAEELQSELKIGISANDKESNKQIH